MKTALATDAQYLAAVKAGSVEWAQQMVDAAAKAAGYTIDAFHGTDEEFTVFDMSKAGSSTGGFLPIRGMFFSNNINHSSHLGDGQQNKRKIRVKLRFKNAYIGKNWNSLDKMMGGDFDQRPDEGLFVLKSKGYDGYILDGGEEMLAIDPSQIKLADPVTYDKQGNVIPLSQRFNSNSEEITNPVVPENEGIPFFHTTTKITKLEDVDISKTSPNSYLGQALYGVLEGGSWKPSHLKSGRILRGTVSGRIIDLSNVTNEDLKRIGQLIGRNIETVPFLTLEKRFGDIGKGLRAAGYSAAIHLGPANTGKHIAIFDVSKIKSIGVDEITNPAGRIPAQFPYEYASYLKRHFPEIWKLGGNIRGNDAFRWWTAYRQGDRSPTVMHWWTVTRPAWIARHYRDHLIAGVVAQIKWGTIGSLGVSGMKRVVETKIRNAR
jgi:hypothetical protein